MNNNTSNAAHQPLMYTLLVLALPILALLSLSTGAGQAGRHELWAWLTEAPSTMSQEQRQLIFETLRMPRLGAALLVGGALGIAGALMQSATRNVLAEPGLLGINAGAALGVVIGIAYAGAESTLSHLPWAAAGALLGHACVLLVAHSAPRDHTPLRLILAGAALSATFQGIAAIVLMSQAANYDQFRFWELGALSGVTPQALSSIAPACVLGMLAACCMVRPLTALRLGDDIARTLGHNPNTLRVLIVFIVALLAGSALALVGPIAFLGLLAPFLARRFAGHHLLRTLLLSGWIGALLLLLADIASRLVSPPFETPASVLIAALGAPLLIWMMRTTQLKSKEIPC